jgi:hypothetical protein
MGTRLEAYWVSPQKKEFGTKEWKDEKERHRENNCSGFLEL